MLICSGMSADTGKNEEQQIAALAKRIQGLEAELSEARAQLVGAHSQLLYARNSFYADAPTHATIQSSTGVGWSRAVPEHEREQESLIQVAPLPVHHPLRRKWKLGAGLSVTATDNNRQRISFTGSHIPTGQVRLFGLLADGEAWERRIPFAELAKEDGLIIGRDPAEAQIHLAENGVSRVHARLELGSTGLVITDLKSTNGLYINGEPVNCYSPQHPLTDGSIIRMGDMVLRVEIIFGSTEPSPTPSSL